MNQPERNRSECIESVILLLRKYTLKFNRPAIVQIIDEFGPDPYLILICCLLSLRAKDAATIPVCRILFKLAKTPLELVSLSLPDLEKIIYPLGFYRNKARIVKSVSADLLERFDGKVPASEEQLLSIKGIGRKTANAVLGYAFKIPSICVDVHVHRIANRLGWVTTKTPEQTEDRLKQLVPEKYWIELNSLMVMWGQNVCVPASPFCSHCAIAQLCPKIGVWRHR